MTQAICTDRARILYVDGGDYAARTFLSVARANVCVEVMTVASARAACLALEAGERFDFVIVPLDAQTLMVPHVVRQLSEGACLGGAALILQTGRDCPAGDAFMSSHSGDIFMVRPDTVCECRALMRLLAPRTDVAAAETRGTVHIAGRGVWNEPLELMAA